jgi:hypothetical protein
MGRAIEMGVRPGTKIREDDQVRRNGLEVFAVEQHEPKPYANVIPSETSRHESKHLAVAVMRGVGVLFATRVPNFDKGYLGAVYTSRFDGPTFMAAAADHESGTGHDVSVASKFGRPGADAATAKSLMDADRPTVDLFARALEFHGTMDGALIDKVYKQAQESKVPKVKFYARADTGETFEILGVGIESINGQLPEEIIEFADKVLEKEKTKKNEEGNPKIHDEKDDRPRLRTRPTSSELIENRKNEQKNGEAQGVAGIGSIVISEFDRIQSEEKLKSVRKELANMRSHPKEDFILAA